MSTEPEGRLQEPSEAVRMSSLDEPGQQAQNADTSGSTTATMTAIAAASASLSAPSATLPGAVETEKHQKEQESSKDDGTEARKDSLSIEPTTTAKSSSNCCQITLLLPTSARHPYKIDERYLSKRNVSTPERTEDGKMDPFSISVYTLKELILREWRDEWDTAPASPGSIRLIFFGKLLDDKLPLREYNFSPDNSNIVHMTIRPLETDEDETAKAAKTQATNSERSGCGCCVVS